jgi:hypothetical protein
MKSWQESVLLLRGVVGARRSRRIAIADSVKTGAGKLYACYRSHWIRWKKLARDCTRQPPAPGSIQSPLELLLLVTICSGKSSLRVRSQHPQTGQALFKCAILDEMPFFFQTNNWTGWNAFPFQINWTEWNAFSFKLIGLDRPDPQNHIERFWKDGWICLSAWQFQTWVHGKYWLL